MDSIEAILAAYRQIGAQRMLGLSIYNDALAVEAVGFTGHGQDRTGVLITPWFMNLVLLPGDDDDWRMLPTGSKVALRFPSGEYELTVIVLDGLGAHLALPLFSDVRAFPNQQIARQVATQVLNDLFQTMAEAEQHRPVDAAIERHALYQPISRRGLLLDWVTSAAGPR